MGVAVRRRVGGAFPGVAVTGQGRRVGDAFLGDEAFERGEPVLVIGVAGIGVAGGLGALDLLGEGRGPFGPGEEPALVQRYRHGKACASHGSRKIGPSSPCGMPGTSSAARAVALRSSAVTPAADKGSNASIETLIVGSASSPHSSWPVNTTV